MSFKKKPSGSEFRKRAAEYQQKEEKELKKVPKITSFFVSNRDCDSTETEPSHSQTETSLSGGSESRNANIENNIGQSSTSPTQTVPDPDSDTILTIQPMTKTIDTLLDNEFVLEDPGTWNVKDEVQVTKILNSHLNQDLEADFSNSEHCYEGVKIKRKLSTKLFFSELPSGDKFKRDWLLYSKSKGKVFCYYCLLFQPEGKRGALANGCNDWKNSFAIALTHERSDDHRANVLTFMIRKGTTSVEHAAQSQYNQDVKYWRDLLTRVVSVVKFLSARGLPFRGDDQKLGSTSNGLFLGCLELISEFDPFLAQHMTKYGNKGRGSTSYLSSDICSEFIDVMSKRVLQEILKEIKQARYFSLIIDSTPDASHTDQLAVALRYVSLSKACANERLVQLLPNVSHKAIGMEEAALNLLKELELDLKNCRGQSYDNASNMSGVYSGLQSRIREKNDLADFVPCTAHSLNLAGCFAAEKACTEATVFFSFVQGLYSFFSSSTHRWDLLREHVKRRNEEKLKTEHRFLMLKSLSETRWSARADALKAQVTSRKEIKSALEDLIDDKTQTPDTRVTAEGFLKTLGNFQTTLLTVIWDEILQRVDKTSETLQKEELDLLGATVELQTLSLFLHEKRNNFHDYEAKALQLADVPEPSYEKIRKKKVFSDEKRDSDFEKMTPRERFRTGVFLPIIDNLTTQLELRRDCYEALNARFQIFRNLHEKKEQDVTNEAKNLAQSYPQDIDEEQFVQECQQFKLYMKVGKITRTRDIYTYIKKNNLESTFPNLEVAMRIYLTIPVTNCTAERSFSALKRIKTEMRSTMENKKLNSLMLLCTQNDITMGIDYDGVINDFAMIKARRKPLLNKYNGNEPNKNENL